MSRAEFEETGRLWLRDVLPASDLRRLGALTEADRPGARVSGNEVLRDVLGPEGCVGRAIAGIWPGQRPVRVVAFAKDGASNWGVPWHQDRVIAVRDRAEVEGFGPWSCKAGRWHCEPPAEVLDAMLFVRLHLDPSTQANGAMEIAVGSHRAGVVASDRAAEAAAIHPTEVCEAQAGDVLVLKMLTLHRSRPSQDGRPRRAIRVDFAGQALPAPLVWAGL